jgi:hypothetical protein
LNLGGTGSSGAQTKIFEALAQAADAQETLEQLDSIADELGVDDELLDSLLTELGLA